VKTVVVVLAIWSSAACGVVGSPVAPEDVGVAPTIERQKRSDTEAADRAGDETQPVLVPQGQDVDLPPLRPVGTR
jgi:predicted small lipoprotein YifL